MREQLSISGQPTLNSGVTEMGKSCIAPDPRVVSNYLDTMDAAYDSQAAMPYVSAYEVTVHSRIPGGDLVHPTRLAMEYARTLLQSSRSRHEGRAIAIISQVLAMQDTDPTSSTFGIWPWYLEEPLERMCPPDLNWADFIGLEIIEILTCADQLPEELVERLRVALHRAALAIFRRNMHVGYTNVAAQSAAVCLIAGQWLDDAMLHAFGREKLAKLLKLEWIDEYNSPTYYLITLCAVERVIRLCDDQQAIADAWTFCRRLWEDMAEHFHPGTQQWCGPHSRAHCDRLQSGAAAFLSLRTGVAIQSHPDETMDKVISWGTLPGVPADADIAQRFEALPDPIVTHHKLYYHRSKYGIDAFGSIWMNRSVCLGCISQEQLSVQARPVVGYLQTPADSAVVLRVQMLKDGRDFASGALRSIQQGSHILSAIGMFADLGEWHPRVDRPVDGCFTMCDLRIRISLNGRDVQVITLEDGRFALQAGAWRTIVTVHPGLFLGQPITWQTVASDGRASVEGICYHGEQRTLILPHDQPVAIPFRLDLKDIDSETEVTPVEMTTGDTEAQVRSGELVMTVPMFAKFYP